MNNENKLTIFTDDKKIFRGKNVWIRDIAATCDVTFRKSVMTNTETPKEYSEVVA